MALEERELRGVAPALAYRCATVTVGCQQYSTHLEEWEILGFKVNFTNIDRKSQVKCENWTILRFVVYSYS